MISIIGAGKVGSACALNIIRMNIADVTLVDVQGGLAEGEALDMRHASPSFGFDRVVKGTTRFEDIAGSEVVIVTAGYPRKPDTSRRDLAQGNARIVSSVAQEVSRYAPESVILVVTNPVDAMTYIAYIKSGFPRNRVLGMGGILDTLRYRTSIASELNVSSEDVQGLIIGEHGDLMIPLTEYTAISGIPVKKLLKPERLSEIIERARFSAMDVIKLKGATVHAPASAVSMMVESIVKGRNRLTVASVIPDGEYGLKDVSIGLPVILGRNGVERIVELELDDDVKSRLVEAASSIQSVISQIQQI
ncbi:MAG: malate dehydrogenase [Candidatus Bathyarchaeia archaeon]|nr:malate dehydrogenase [Candidatus Bathyarchaeota archaeon]